jgi:hypothetical protein
LIAGIDYDQVNIAGGITLAGDLEVSLLNNFNFAMGDLFFVLVNDGSDPVVENFANVTGRLTVSGVEFDVFYSANAASESCSDCACLAETSPEKRMET